MTAIRRHGKAALSAETTLTVKAAVIRPKRTKYGLRKKWGPNDWVQLAIQTLYGDPP
jgi:hypothetical protein